MSKNVFEASSQCQKYDEFGFHLSQGIDFNSEDSLHWPSFHAYQDEAFTKDCCSPSYTADYSSYKDNHEKARNVHNLFSEKGSDACENGRKGSLQTSVWNILSTEESAKKPESANLNQKVQDLSENSNGKGDDKIEDIEGLVSKLVSTTGLKYPKVNTSVPRKDVIYKNMLRSMSRFLKVSAKQHVPELFTCKNPEKLDQLLEDFCKIVLPNRSCDEEFKYVLGAFTIGPVMKSLNMTQNVKLTVANIQNCLSKFTLKGMTALTKLRGVKNCFYFFISEGKKYFFSQTFVEMHREHYEKSLMDLQLLFNKS